MLKVMFVDDSADLTRLVGLAISREPGLASAGELNSTERLVEEIEQKKPDVVVLDLGMPGTDVIALIGRLREVSPEVRILVYSGYDDQETIDLAIDAGACGHVSKKHRLDQLFETIREVAGRGREPR